MAMTAHELARKLLAGPDLPVHSSHDYRDRTHTTVTPTVDRAERREIRHSAYHQMDRLVEEDDDAGEGAREVIVLS